MLDTRTLDIIHNQDDTTDVDKAIKNLMADPKNREDVNVILKHIDDLRNAIIILSHRS